RRREITGELVFLQHQARIGDAEPKPDAAGAAVAARLPVLIREVEAWAGFPVAQTALRIDRNRRPGAEADVVAGLHSGQRLIGWPILCSNECWCGEEQ